MSNTLAGRIVPSVGIERTVLLSLVERARTTPDAPAICVHDLSGKARDAFTYLELSTAVLRASLALQQHVASDETVVLNVPNGFEHVGWFLGGLHAGVRIASVHPAATRHELSRIIGRTGARAIIGPGPQSGLMHLLPSSINTGSRPGLLATERRGQGSVVLESSGTAGAPKLVRRSEASLDADARGVVHGARLSETDRLLLVVPMSHSYGVDLLLATILAGASIHVLSGFELACAHTLIELGQVSVFPGVPFMYEALARSASFQPGAGFRLALSAGSSLPEKLHARLRSEHGLVVGQLYGATELGTVALDHPDAPGFDATSVGPPLPGVSVRVVNPEDSSKGLPMGSEGELAVRAPSMLDQYLHDDVPLVDGHFRTGDLGLVDASGRIHITGRLKHLIDVGGLKVNPLEVERVMGEHPEIAECALVPLPLSETVVRLRLIFVPRPGAALSIEELRSFARERLSPHKLPRAFEPVATLPRSATGKLQRHLLVQP